MEIMIMYATTKGMLERASSGSYAVGAFNVENAEMVWAVIAAAEESRAPVIIQTTPGTLHYLGPGYFAGMATRMAEEASVPVALHLDHGSSFDLVKKCVDIGYSSIMIDGSKLPYEENVAYTARVREAAAKKAIPVEGELGIVGGKDDDASEDGIKYTDPEQAADFVSRTRVSSLAIAIGTAHGFYNTVPILDLDLITATRKLVRIPLVMHGASGLSDETVSHAARLGMAKINFATELRETYTKTVRTYLSANRDVFDPKKFGEPARLAVKELVKRKIAACLSEGKA
jgi:tagatose 1,6-diphosphate aldolase GatY/KbaY